MKLTETMYFDKNKYCKKISNSSFSDEKLGKEIYAKRAKRLSAKVRVGVSTAAATVTGGGTLVSAAFSGRNVSVEGQKLKLLEEEWARRGYQPLPKRKFKDKIVPIAITAATSTFAAGMDAVFAVASPDQFAQLVPNTEVNDFLISNVYYGGLEKASSIAGNAVVGKVVSGNSKDIRNSKSAYEDEEEDEDEEEEDEDEEDYEDEEEYDDEKEEEEEDEGEDEDEDEEDEEDDEDEKKYRW